MTAPPDLHLPPDVATTLDALSIALRTAAGGNLLALILYGGLARGRYNPETSDINVVVLLRDASASAIQRLAAPLHAAWRAKRVEPLIVTPGDLARLPITFPTKVLDIQRRHVALYGDDPFDGLEVSRAHLRLRVEQELQNLALRLRRRFVAIHADPGALALAASDAAPTLAVNLRVLLFLRGIVADDLEPTPAIYERAAHVFGLDAEALEAAKRLRKGGRDATLDPELFGRLLTTVDKAADIAAAIET